MNPRRNMAQIIIKAFKLLEEEKALQQVDVLAKMKALGFKISKASFSNIINEQGAGVKVLRIASEGILAVVKAELGYSYDHESGQFEQMAEWEKMDIPLVLSVDAMSGQSFRFHDKGRLTIQEKVAFMENAQREVVELGVRLNTFVNYFYSRNEHEFRKPVENLIRSGITIKVFFVDPDSNEARLYFEDRAKVQPDEASSPEIIKIVKKKLQDIHHELNNGNWKGKFEVYSYKHIPYSHFLLTDGKYTHGKMMVSNYLYGLRRADCPVIEIHKQDNYDLYQKYYQSFKAITKNAKKVDFNK